MPLIWCRLPHLVLDAAHAGWSVFLAPPLPFGGFGTLVVAAGLPNLVEEVRKPEMGVGGRRPHYVTVVGVYAKLAVNDGMQGHLSGFRSGRGTAWSFPSQ